MWWKPGPEGTSRKDMLFLTLIPTLTSLLSSPLRYKDRDYTHQHVITNKARRLYYSTSCWRYTNPGILVNPSCLATVLPQRTYLFTLIMSLNSLFHRPHPLSNTPDFLLELEAIRSLALLSSLYTNIPFDVFQLPANRCLEMVTPISPLLTSHPSWPMSSPSWAITN